VGHILYLDADMPSEKTTMLHGLYSVGPDGREHLITHEQEPQDVDAGAREWIIEPAASPDGTQVAFVKRLITIEEEKQSVDNQIWIASLTSAKPDNGHILYDLTANKLDMVTRLAWTPDGKSVAFLDGASLYTLDKAGGKPTKTFIPTNDELASRKGTSETSLAGFTAKHEPILYIDRTGEANFGTYTVTGAAAVATDSGHGNIAFAVNKPAPEITVMDSSGAKRTYRPQFGWSIFGGRQVTSVRFSPDDRYIAYTVSKPPVAENEMFYLDTQTGKCYKLPFRCGSAAWDWSHLPGGG
jgi:hypothetical protein